jgi:hypothetical protein
MPADQIGFNGRRRDLFGWFHKSILTQRRKGAKTQRFIKKRLAKNLFNFLFAALRLCVFALNFLPAFRNFRAKLIFL